MTQPYEERTALLGVDIGGTKTAAVLFDANHRPRVRLQAPTPAHRGADAVAAQALELAAQALSRATEHELRVANVGIGTAGTVGRDSRTITFATSALPGWAGTPLADLAEQRLGLPAKLIGDVQAFLMGEIAAGAATGAASAVAVMAGTGIGGAVSVGGDVLLGSHGAAGSLGHLPVPTAAGLTCPCGARGHVEAVASGPAMTARYNDLADATATNLHDIAAAAAAGDMLAQRVLTAGGTALGEALAAVTAVVDCDVIIVEGGVLHSGPWYGQALRKRITSCALPLLRDVTVVPAALGADAVALGAAVHATRLL
ncbi:ROK family protein [Streptomyces sp. NPDC001914]|uniref:ROK family protein n=1 Tax=Streptomyces sp. NPDC001914 TaxID=3364623 RepID=UPI0036CBD8C9